MTILNMARDVNGCNTFIRSPSKYKYSTYLASGIVQTLTVPFTGNTNTQCLAIFAPEVGGSVWVALNETATVPGASFALTTSECNPVGYIVKSGDVLSFVTNDDTSSIGVSFYDLSI